MRRAEAIIETAATRIEIESTSSASGLVEFSTLVEVRVPITPRWVRPVVLAMPTHTGSVPRHPAAGS